MPIYEYICRSCGVEFEELVRSSDEKPNCPVCRSDVVDKKISLVSSPTDPSSGYSVPASNCTGFS